jgi:hypothetical protein
MSGRARTQAARRFPFARKAGARRVASETPDLDEQEHGRSCAPRLLQCADKAIVSLSSPQAPGRRPRRKRSRGDRKALASLGEQVCCPDADGNVDMPKGCGGALERSQQ